MDRIETRAPRVRYRFFRDGLLVSGYIVLLLSMAGPSAAAGAGAGAGEFATLYQNSGKVMVNQGEKHIFAPERLLLKPGHRVMTMRGGSARIEFHGGCRVTLGPREVYLITKTSPCATHGPGISHANKAMNPPARSRGRYKTKLTRELHLGR